MSKRENVFSATVPVSAFAAVPRSVTVAATGGTQARAQTFHPFNSLPNPDTPEDTDSSLVDYQQARHTTPCVLLDNYMHV